MPLLVASNLTKTYASSDLVASVVLRGADFACNRGEFVAIMGPSGAGKSTLLHILASLDVPDSGAVSLSHDGKVFTYASLSQNRLAQLRNKYFGVVFQFHHLLPEFSAVENVMMPLLIAGETKSAARERAVRMLDRVGLHRRYHNLPSELSGGEQQRVAIARALVPSPLIVFADEPTGNLDTANARDVVNLFAELQAENGMACVVATHSAELADFASRIVRMQDGICITDEK